MKTKSVCGFRLYSGEIILPVQAAYSAQPYWVHRCSVAEAAVVLPRRIGAVYCGRKPHTVWERYRGDVKKAVLSVHGSKHIEICWAVFRFVLKKKPYQFNFYLRNS